MLKRREVKTYKVDLICDECGTPMEFTGVVLTSYPGQYVHKCPNCGRTESPACAYPITEYEYIDEDGE
jgi:uncharacterized Zn finger protein